MEFFINTDHGEREVYIRGDTGEIKLDYLSMCTTESTEHILNDSSMSMSDKENCFNFICSVKTGDAESGPWELEVEDPTDLIDRLNDSENDSELFDKEYHFGEYTFKLDNDNIKFTLSNGDFESKIVCDITLDRETHKEQVVKFLEEIRSDAQHMYDTEIRPKLKALKNSR